MKIISEQFDFPFLYVPDCASKIKELRFPARSDSVRDGSSLFRSCFVYARYSCVKFAVKALTFYNKNILSLKKAGLLMKMKSFFTVCHWVYNVSSFIPGGLWLQMAFSTDLTVCRHVAYILWILVQYQFTLLYLIFPFPDQIHT